MKQNLCTLLFLLGPVVAHGPSIQLNAQDWIYTTLAGNVPYSSADGLAASARFYNPTSVAADKSGNVYVVDFVNHTIRKISPAGIVSTLAGLAGASGTNDAQGSAARFTNPTGVAVDSSNDVFVADFGNHTIRKITPAGMVSTLAGLAGAPGTNDGTGDAARFNLPYGLAVDRSNVIYVADSSNHTIRKISPAGVVSTLAGLPGVWGTNNGTGGAARFHTPTGVTLDPSMDVFVADYFNHAIRKITPAGLVSTFAGRLGISGTLNGTGTAARFNNPSSVAADGRTNIFVADYGNQTIRKITSAAAVTTFAGLALTSGSTDGTGSAARFLAPNGVALDAATNIYVADNGNSTIRKITPAAVVTTFAGRTGGVGSTDGSGSLARFNVPNSLALDSSNYLYLADEGNDTIRKISPAGVVSTLAGLAGVSGSANGTGTAARFNHPEGVAVDRASNVYVADQFNNTIRKVTPARVVTTIAGLAGSAGALDGTNSTARFNSPSDVAVDGAGNVYVTDYGNETVRKLRPLGINWIVTTIAGLAGVTGSADGTNSAARFSSPYDLAVDAGGSLYVADTANQLIRKVTPLGTNWVVTTLAGQLGTVGSADGTNQAAQFTFPNAVAVNASGELFVADSGNYTIRKLTPIGTDWAVTTVGGVAGAAGSADGTAATARFNSPYGVAVDSSNNLYVADSGNNTVRKAIPTSALPPVILRQPGLTAGQFAFWITGASGLRVDLESAEDLPNFQPVTSYVLEGGSNYFTGIAPVPGPRYYRSRVP